MAKPKAEIYKEILDMGKDTFRDRAIAKGKDLSPKAVDSIFGTIRRFFEDAKSPNCEKCSSRAQFFAVDKKEPDFTDINKYCSEHSQYYDDYPDEFIFLTLDELRVIEVLYDIKYPEGLFE